MDDIDAHFIKAELLRRMSEPAGVRQARERARQADAARGEIPGDAKITATFFALDDSLGMQELYTPVIEPPQRSRI